MQERSGICYKRIAGAFKRCPCRTSVINSLTPVRTDGMVPPPGHDPETSRLAGERSIQLSYEGRGLEAGRCKRPTTRDYVVIIVFST